MKRRKRQMTTLDYFRNNVKWFMLAVAVIFIAGIFVGPGFGSYGPIQCNGAAGPDPSGTRMEDDVIARVGDKEFRSNQILFQTEQQIRRIREFNPNAALPPETNTQTQWYVLDEMIKNAVLLDYAKKNKEISVPSEEVDERYQQQKISIMQQLGLIDANQSTEASIAQLAHRGVQAQKSEKAFQSFLAQKGLSAKIIRDDIRDNLLIEALNDKMNEEAKVEVSAEAKLKAQEIFEILATDGSDMEEVANREEYETATYRRITDQTRKNAKSTSEDLSTRLFTGELKKTLEPLEINDNWTIIFIEERVLAEGDDFDKAKDDIIDEIKLELGIFDTSDNEFNEIAEISEEEFQRMIMEEGLSEGSEEAEIEISDASDMITDDMIQERYEKVTYRQIQVSPESTYTRVQDRINDLKRAAGVEILDPMLKAYSYIADFDPENKDFDKAIEEFRSIRNDLIEEVSQTEADFILADEKAESAPENAPNKYELLTEASYAEQSYLFAKDSLARINYMIANTMRQKIESIESRHAQEFFKLRDGDPDSFADMSLPELPKEEQEKIEELKNEIYDLMSEAVELVAMTVLHYNAIIADLQMEREEWVAAFDNWSKVIDYGVKDLELLREADRALDRLLDMLSEVDEAKREEATDVYDKLQQGLLEAEALDQEQRQRQQEWMQRMIEEQMAEMGE